MRDRRQYRRLGEERVKLLKMFAPYVRQEPSLGAGRILREVVETEGRDSRAPGQGLM